MIDRRALLKAGMGLGLALPLASRAAAQEDRTALRPQEGDLLIRSGDAATTPLTPADIQLAAVQTFAWAMDPADRTVRSGSRLNQVVVIRFDPATLSAETRSRAADGVVAYSSICPHTGCDVDDFLAAEQQLSCPCHFSIFDPKDGGKVVDGPAPRMLPALPLAVVDGKLVVAKPFTAPISFEKG